MPSGPRERNSTWGKRASASRPRTIWRWMRSARSSGACRWIAGWRSRRQHAGDRGRDHLAAAERRRKDGLVRAIILLMSAAAWALAPADDQRAPTPPEPTEAEIRLAEGPFAALAGAALGAPRPFENDLDSTECFPVRASGRVLAWIHRAHRAASRLFVEPCEPYGETATV